MTRKALVFLISVWITSNFGCSGLKSPNFSANNIIEIPLTAITHIGLSESMILDFPTPLSLNYAEECPEAKTGIPG
ncbi:MAG: hypothetical protein MUP98_20555 [Candidatus Aminicenantes bacterium]|nr:hypothetical protein [Candidatus Aminicenantes bacterium]